MWYWAGDEEAAATQSRFTTRRRVYLPPYTMQELKVGPLPPCFRPSM
jgi:hypothetical protein